MQMRWLKLPAMFQLPAAWRPFAGEVGKIILGVLIALALGAVATDIGWSIEVDNARRALKNELGESIGQSDERVNVSPCVERRLNEIALILEQSSKAKRLPPVGDFAIPPFRTWNRGVWNSVVTSQTGSHFPREELTAYVQVNEFVGILSETNRQELDAWRRLYAVVGPGRPVELREIADLRNSLSEARLLHRIMAMASLRAKQTATAWNLAYDQSTAQEYSGKPLSEYPICSSVSANVPPIYGSAPWGNIIEKVKANPVSRTPGKR